MTRYTSLAIGAPARLATLRAAAIKHNAPPYVRNSNATWRDVRYANLRNASGLSQGLNDGAPVWYCHDDGAQFRNERDAADIVDMRHTGYYTDGDDCSETAVGIVASLPHGRFIAGYRLTMNDERVYFPEVHDTERDAALMADEHARIIGEQESEYSNRWREAYDLQESINELTQELGKSLALRHHPRFSSPDEIRHIIQQIRDARETLARDYGDVEIRLNPISNCSFGRAVMHGRADISVRY